MSLINFVQSRSKNFWLLELSSSLHFIASSITSIFIPIIMLTLGFELLDVILFYIIFHFLDVLLIFISKKSLETLGVKFSYIFGTIFIILFFWIYLFLDGKNWHILFLMALIYAIYDAFYYTAFYYGTMANTLKIENSDMNNIIINWLSTVSFFIGPLIGAAIILFSENQNILLITTIFIFTFSLIPLFYCDKKQKIPKQSLNLKAFFSDLRNKKNFISWGLIRIIESAEYILIPIFVYLMYQELDSIALISIISVFTSLLFIFMSGNIEKEKREKIIILGSITLIFIWLGRIFIDNTIFLYSSISLTSIFLLFIRIPIETNIFKHGKETQQFTTAILKNLISMFSKGVFYLIVFILLYFMELKNIFWLIMIILILLITTNLIYIWFKNKKHI